MGQAGKREQATEVRRRPKHLISKLKIKPVFGGLFHPVELHPRRGTHAGECRSEPQSENECTGRDEGDTFKSPIASVGAPVRRDRPNSPVRLGDQTGANRRFRTRTRNM